MVRGEPQVQSGPWRSSIYRKKKHLWKRRACSPHFERWTKAWFRQRRASNCSSWNWVTSWRNSWSLIWKKTIKNESTPPSFNRIVQENNIRTLFRTYAWDIVRLWKIQVALKSRLFWKCAINVFWNQGCFQNVPESPYSHSPTTLTPVYHKLTMFTSFNHNYPWLTMLYHTNPYIPLSLPCPTTLTPIHPKLTMLFFKLTMFYRINPYLTLVLPH